MESPGNRRIIRLRTIIKGLACVAYLIVCHMCRPGNTPDGQSLAERTCAVCHKYPEPALLDRATWEKYMLPRMGAMLGHYSDSLSRAQLLAEGGADVLEINKKVWPEKPVVTDETWEAIRAFYLSSSPDVLPEAVSKDVVTGTSTDLFQARYPAYFLSPPSTSFVRFTTRGIEIADVHTKKLYAFNTDLELIATASAGEGVVSHVDVAGSPCYIVMGSFAPGDAAHGEFIALGAQRQTLIDQLVRPVHACIIHRSEKDAPAIVISEYGKWSGALSLWTMGEGKAQRRNLMERSGAICSVAEDFDQDGDEDLLALFGQGDEGFWMFRNDNGAFTPERLIQFSPAHGSTSFMLADMNADGRKDIIYTAGDGADYPAIVKPCHGVYIFLAQGDGTFAQAAFLPLPGAYKAIPADFDADGDIDIAAIAFFPDFEAEVPQAFVYYESDGKGQYISHVLDIAEKGRWMVMDAGDVDEDGDTDLILGALVMEVPGHEELVQTWTEQGIPFVVLENTLYSPN